VSEIGALHAVWIQLNGIVVDVQLFEFLVKGHGYLPVFSVFGKISATSTVGLVEKGDSFISAFMSLVPNDNILDVGGFVRWPTPIPPQAQQKKMVRCLYQRSGILERDPICVLADAPA
jgi:hypothetical protein